MILPRVLFEKVISIRTDFSTKKEVVKVISLKKGGKISAKNFPENIEAFARKEMSPSGYAVLTVFVDVLFTIIGLDKSMLKCDRIIFARADREKEGIKGIGLATGNKCQVSYDGQTNKEDKLYVYGGAQCMILYKDERAIANGPFAQFGCIVRKTRRPVLRLPHLGIKTILGQQSALHA